MVACLFARSVYSEEVLGDALKVTGYTELAKNLDQSAEYIRKLRWQTRFATGFHPDQVSIPKRFYSVKTWKGKIDKNFLDGLKQEYGKRLLQFAAPEPE